MSFIEFKHIGKKYAGAEHKSVDDFNLNIEEKEFIAFVGPSGCGKSTTLRMIAGFEEITEGDLYIDGKRVNETAPRDRGIAMVFQNYALYPHMTVEKNIGYGLKNMKMPADQIKKKVDWAIDILGLQEFRYRKPKNLSGGQRQRVALGRAIVKNQKVFLMDEPLSNLDAKLRVSMRTEISKLHREMGATTIYVTHDQVEAMTMADRIVIMKEGVIQQVGKPMELYDHPVNKFVAGFIGSPQMNFFDVTLKGNEVTFEDGNKLMLPEAILKKLNGKEGEMTLGIRGEDLKMDAQNLELYKENKMKAVILAGGYGTRLSEATNLIPKPMVEIGGKPILWHIMKEYAYYGYNEFIICAGYKQEYIKEWFANYFLYNSDVSFNFRNGKNEITVHHSNLEPWKVTIVDTGYNTLTGGRIKRIKEYVNNETFMMTYGDGVCDVDINKLVAFHKKHGKIATLTAVIQAQDKGVLNIDENNSIRSFREKNINDGVPINAGYMVLEPRVFDYIEGDQTIFEKEPLNKLATEGELMSYTHKGFWQCMDNIREKNLLEQLLIDGVAPWKKWEREIPIIK